MSVQLVYETHSLTLDNEDGVATGWLPGTLSPAGREQARLLGERRRNDGLAAVYASDLRRAVETVEIAFGESTIPVQLDPRLRECDYGDLNGAPADQIAAERARRIEVPYPNGESYRAVVERMRSFLDEVAPRHDGERILLVSHAAPRWALDHLLNGVPLEQLVDAPFEWREGWDYVLRRP
jgi:alpha-ribazole phosphatase/probable phosphoglycerate mutase